MAVLMREGIDWNGSKTPYAEFGKSAAYVNGSTKGKKWNKSSLIAGVRPKGCKKTLSRLFCS